MLTQTTNDFYRQAWHDGQFQPNIPVPGSNDRDFQRMARYCRAIACSSGIPFPVPVGITAQVSGYAPQVVGRYLGELVFRKVIRVVERGGPGRFTRYAWVGGPR
jgi:hypothetical protein